MKAAPLVEVSNLTRVFDVSKPWLNRVIEREGKAYLKAVNGVSFSIGRRETLALVGEFQHGPQYRHRGRCRWGGAGSPGQGRY